MKRQQAAEDAIALCMAKVTTRQKINRLPPGKIFGMTVTEPDIANKTKEDDPANQDLTNSFVENNPIKGGSNSAENTDLPSHNYEQKNQVNFFQKIINMFYNVVIINNSKINKNSGRAF